MPTWVNQNGTRKEVKKMWVNQDGTVKEVKTGWANQGGTVEKVYSTAVNADIVSGTYYNKRGSTSSFDYGAALHNIVPPGTDLSASPVINLNLTGGNFYGAAYGYSSGCTRTVFFYSNAMHAQSHFGGSGGSGRAETSVPAIYIGGPNQNSTYAPSLSASQRIPHGSIINLTIDGALLRGSGGRQGRGRCNNHGCHANNNNTGGTGGACILIDGVNNCTVNVTYISGTIQGGGGGGGGTTTGAHSHCCPKWGGGGQGSYWSSSNHNAGSLGNNSNYQGCEGSHGAPEGGRGGTYGNNGGNGHYLGGYGGSFIEFRNCSNPTYNAVSGSVPTSQINNRAVTTTNARADGHTVLVS